MSGMAVLWTVPIWGEVEEAEVEQGKASVMLPLQVRARVVRVARAAGCLHRPVIIPTWITVKAIRAELKADPARIMGMVERAKATVEVEESGEMRIGITEMAMPGTGTIRRRERVRPQAK
jgi:hypothetical protein